MHLLKDLKFHYYSLILLYATGTSLPQTPIPSLWFRGILAAEETPGAAGESGPQPLSGQLSVTYLNTSATDSHPFSVVPWNSSSGGDTRSRGRIWSTTAVRITTTATRRNDIVQMGLHVTRRLYIDVHLVYGLS